MTSPEDAWANDRACTEIKCREAREDERRRIVDYLRQLGGWGAVSAAALEGDDYWRHERAELSRYRSHAPDATDHTSTSAGDA